MILQLLLLSMAVAAQATTQGDRQIMLDCHNKYRAQLALGKVPGQPAAADMTVMDYDVKIEARAINWNDQCQTGHDPSSNRLVKEAAYAKFTSIGQNWAGFTRGAISRSCDMWWNEYKDYSYESNKSINGGVVGHYTAMAWSTSNLVGCGVNKGCSNSYGQHITCNYAPSGNMMGQKPYINGKACSQCPDGYNFCMGGALCARKDQCIGADCTCAITKCENDGTLNGCKCACKEGSYGDRCQNLCKDTNKYCAPAYNIDCSNSYWSKNCKARCGGCKAGVPFVTAASSGVKPKVDAAAGGNNNGEGAPATSAPAPATEAPAPATEAPAPATEAPAPATEAPSACKDYRDSFCSQRKDKCWCPIIKASCPVTCKACEWQQACVDRYYHCASTIKAWGGCRGQLSFICRKSCNQCGGAAAAAQQKPTPAPQTANATCKDYSESFCTRNKGNCYCPLVKASCPVTCNACDYWKECKDRYWDRCPSAIKSWGGCRGQLNFICRKSCNQC